MTPASLRPRMLNLESAGLAKTGPALSRHGVIMPYSVPLLTGVLIAMLMLSMLGPIMTINVASGGSANGGGNAVRQVLYFGAFLAAFIGMRGFMLPGRMLVVPWPIIAVLAYCWFSLTWSAVPGIAGRRLMLTTMITWTIFAAIVPLGYARTVYVMRVLMVGVLVTNFAVVLLVPGLGIHQAADVIDANLIGDWRGFMMQKNLTAAATACTLLLFLFNGGDIPKWIRYPVLLAAAFMLVKTGSRTSAGACVGAALMGVAYLLYNARYRAALILPVILLAAFGFSLPWLLGPGWMPQVEDPRTLSGRLQIWDLVWRYSMDHLYRGAGYGSFWDLGGFGPAVDYGKGWVVALPEAHNGYLELLSTIGLPGLALVLVCVFVLPITRLLMSRAANGGRGALVLSLIIFCAGQNGTESTLLNRDAIPQVYLMAALALLLLITDDLPNRPLPFGATALARRFRLRQNDG
jgi:exopolysaccharide production protein ExoQ